MILLLHEVISRGTDLYQEIVAIVGELQSLLNFTVDDILHVAVRLKENLQFLRCGTL